MVYGKKILSKTIFKYSIPVYLLKIGRNRKGTFWIYSLDFVSGLAGSARSESVQSTDSVSIPLAFSETGHLALQLWDHVSAGLPLIGSSLASLHIITPDTGAAVIFWRFPGQEDATGGLVSPPQVFWWVRHG